MNVANIIILIVIALMAVVVGGVIYIIAQASRRRPAGGVAPATESTDWSVLSKLALLVGFALLALYHSAITSWFVSDDIVNNLGLWLNPVFWIGAIGALTIGLSLLKGSGVVGTDSSSLSQHSTKVVRLLLLGAAGALIYFLFFTDLFVKIAAWDWTATPAGPLAEETFGEMTNVVMWVLLIVTIFIAWRIISPKKPKAGNSANNVGDTAFGLFGLAIIAVIVGLVGLVALAIVDVFTGGAVGRMGDRFVLAPAGIIDLNPPSTVQCGELEERYGDTMDPRIGFNYVVVDVCPGDGRQYIRVEQNVDFRYLDIGYHQSAINEHGEALTSRPVSHFVNYQQAGQSGTAYYVFVNPQAFNDLGVDHLKFVVRIAP